MRGQGNKKPSGNSDDGDCCDFLNTPVLRNRDSGAFYVQGAGKSALQLRESFKSMNN